MLGCHRSEDANVEADSLTAKSALVQAHYLFDGVRNAIATTTLHHLTTSLAKGEEVHVLSGNEDARERLIEFKSMIRKSLVASLGRAVLFPLAGIALDAASVGTPPFLEISISLTLAANELRHASRAVRLLARDDLGVTFSLDKNLQKFESVLKSDGETAARQFLDDADGILDNGLFTSEYVGLAEQLSISDEPFGQRLKKVLQPLSARLKAVLSKRMPHSKLGATESIA